MKKNNLILIVGFISLLSCKENRVIKYSGYDDLVVGSETINLFENGEFSLEIGVGYNDGTYRIQHDTIVLLYSQKTNLPTRFFLTQDKFESIAFKRKITINRTDKNIVDHTNKRSQLPQGKFKYELYFSEFAGRMDNKTCNVEINQNSILITQDETTNLSNGKIIFKGIVVKHKSGKWILAQHSTDENAEEIGGCTDFPIIEFNKKLIEWC